VPQAPLIIRIREDEKAGVVRAYFMTIDESYRQEVATISVGILKSTPGAFEAWQAILKNALVAFMEHCAGHPLNGITFDVIRPHELN